MVQIKFQSIDNKLLQMLKQSHLEEVDQSSSEHPKAFVGKYHSVLRRRKNAQEELPIPPKKQYKKKRITHKNLFFLHASLYLETPLPQNHVYNFRNILAINQHSMRNPDCEESFISSKFYMKKVQKVTIQKDCLLLMLEDYEHSSTPVAYICERLKSMGDLAMLELAQTIEQLEQTLPELNKKLVKDVYSQEQGLSQFLGEMAKRPFFSQYSPNLLIISSPLLQLLGYEVEQFAIESIKYKSILNEFFSAQHYTEIIRKHLQNINLLKDYLEGKMTLDDFCQRSLIVCSDYIYNRHNKKIKCHFFGGTSKQLTPYIEIKQLNSDQEEVLSFSDKMMDRKTKIQQFKQSHKHKEVALLRQLINIPKQLDPHFKPKICNYKLLESLML